MAKASIPKTNFIGGQIGRFAFNRVDAETHKNGCELLENVVVIPQGPAQNRAGTRHVSPSKVQAKTARLIRFVFSTVQAYVLEFGDQYIRFYRDRGQILSGGVPYEISTPYLEADLDAIQITQSADVLFLTHPLYKDKQLTRTGHTSWTLTDRAPTADPFTGVGDYPRAICLHEERLVEGGTNNKPQTFKSSKSQDYNNMTTGTLDADGYSYTISSDEVNTIEWLFSDTFMLAGTAGGIFAIRGSGLEEAITPSNVYVKRHVGQKAAADKPLLVQDQPLFIARSRQKLFGLAIGDNGKYKAAEISFKAKGMLKAKIKQLGWQEDPDSIVWSVRGDGVLMGVTVELAEGVIAWHTHKLGGNGIVESLCTIPGVDGDELWLLVRRTVNGQTVRYIEFMETRKDEVHTDFFFLDSGLTYSGAATTTIAGLGHLEGMTVGVLADGAWHPDRVVTGGQITLQKAASKACVGLKYVSTIITTKQGEGSQTGSALGKLKRMNKCTLHLDNTIGCAVGTKIENLKEQVFRGKNDPMDAPPPIFSGDLEVVMPDGYDKEGKVIIQQRLPMPMTVLGITPKTNVSD